MSSLGYNSHTVTVQKKDWKPITFMRKFFTRETINLDSQSLTEHNANLSTQMYTSKKQDLKVLQL